ncbi:NAD(P)H-binding protein [Amycolatopsis nigrescens]|uniref:NAD(P)H-binding protein n=1 Tax=Amycolatopsis nigrescens TaxID=381445 RepID=UPI0003669015|nr:NAD(P)H-binding protein [Amycolatopsis nigrescens]
MILVTGASGGVGRLLVDRLAAEGAEVRAVTRDPAAAALPAEVETVVGDPARPGTIERHFRGVTALFLHPRAVAERAGEVVALARENGVRRVVALSAMNVDDELDAQPSRFAGDRNKEAEAAAVGSGLEWVSLRAGAFAGNSLRMWGAQIRAGDVIRGPYATFAEAPLHEGDLAAVAVRALLGDELLGRRPVLTGPHSLTHEEMIAVIGHVLGRTLSYQEIPPEVVLSAMVRNGHPEPFVKALMARYVREGGRPAQVSGEVEKILGRPARGFAEWVSDHASAFTS